METGAIVGVTARRRWPRPSSRRRINRGHGRDPRWSATRGITARWWRWPSGRSYVVEPDRGHATGRGRTRPRRGELSLPPPPDSRAGPTVAAAAPWWNVASLRHRGHAPGPSASPCQHPEATARTSAAPISGCLPSDGRRSPRSLQGRATAVFAPLTTAVSRLTLVALSWVLDAPADSSSIDPRTRCHEHLSRFTNQGCLLGVPAVPARWRAPRPDTRSQASASWGGCDYLRSSTGANPTCSRHESS